MVEADGKAQNGDQDRFSPFSSGRKVEDSSFTQMLWRLLR